MSAVAGPLSVLPSAGGAVSSIMGATSQNPVAVWHPHSQQVVHEGDPRQAPCQRECMVAGVVKTWLGSMGGRLWWQGMWARLFECMQGCAQHRARRVHHMPVGMAGVPSSAQGLCPLLHNHTGRAGVRAAEARAGGGQERAARPGGHLPHGRRNGAPPRAGWAEWLVRPCVTKPSVALLASVLHPHMRVLSVPCSVSLDRHGL